MGPFSYSSYSSSPGLEKLLAHCTAMLPESMCWHQEILMQLGSSSVFPRDLWRPCHGEIHYMWVYHSMLGQGMLMVISGEN